MLKEIKMIHDEDDVYLIIFEFRVLVLLLQQEQSFKITVFIFAMVS